MQPFSGWTKWKITKLFGSFSQFFMAVSLISNSDHKQFKNKCIYKAYSYIRLGWVKASKAPQGRFIYRIL